MSPTISLDTFAKKHFDKKVHRIKHFEQPFFVGISLALALQTMKVCSRSSKGDTPCHL
jgi:hypothetical protein